ncbi:hypothetical protein ACLOJK_005792 [Asimina triloba]
MGTVVSHPLDSNLKLIWMDEIYMGVQILLALEPARSGGQCVGGRCSPTTAEEEAAVFTFHGYQRSRLDLGSAVFSVGVSTFWHRGGCKDVVTLSHDRTVMTQCREDVSRIVALVVAGFVDGWGFSVAEKMIPEQGAHEDY